MLNRSYDEEEFEDEDDGESYLASYSDLVTDLMAVFVLLLSFALLTQATSNRSASPDLMSDSSGSGLLSAGQYLEYSEYLKQAEYDADSKNSANNYNEVDTRTQELIKELEEAIAEAGLQTQVRVSQQGKSRIMMRMMDSVLFDTGKAAIKENMKPILDGIGDILAEYNNVIKYIHIEGHTDNRPINTAQFPSNWELSTGRAGSVVRFLIEKTDIPGEKFSSAGYGEFRPLADNATEEGKSINRRVEFTIEVKDADA